MTRLSKPSLIATLLLLAMTFFVMALTLGAPTWAPLAPATNSTLNCSWTFSVDTLAQNITLLRDGAVFNFSYENASAITLSTYVLVPSENTTKGEKWTCRITLFNESTSTVQEINVTIINSPPTTEGTGAGIFNESNDDVDFLVQIPEDTTVLLDVNATDADSDTLTYLAGDEFCTRTSSSAGTYTCLPDQDDLQNNAPTQYNITFTVSDGQNVGGRTVTFNVTPVNDAPVATVANQTTPVNQSKNVTFTASDVESNYPLSLQLLAPAEITDKLTLTPLNVNGTSFSVYYDASTPDFNDVGLWNVTVNVTDNSSTPGGLNDSISATYTYVFNISASGRAPYFINISPSGNSYNLTEEVFFQINISANDSDVGSTLTFTDDTTRFATATTNGNTSAGVATGQINFTPTNSDVGVFTVVITITDSEGLTNTTSLTFNVSNVNDAPFINELSYSTSNTQSNQNASNLTAYANTLFIYDVNVTDDDSIHGDTLTFADNSSLFDINSSTGRIRFTPSDDDVQPGVYHINVSVSDASFLNASRTIILRINANSPPFFNITPLPALNCTTDASCLFGLGGVSEDPDAGDNITSYNISFIGSSIESFSYNSTSGVINFTTQKYDAGNYTINITIADIFGATNHSLMNISINNTPVSPNLTQFNFSTQTIVENKTTTYELQATDRDFLVSFSGEVVNFTTNLSINYTITPLSTSNITARASLQISPAIGDAGNYTVHMNATDAFGLVSQRTVIFNVLPQVPPPNITQVTPWGSGSNASLETSYANTTDATLIDMATEVNFSENTTVLFNVSVVDTRPLTYNWTLNGVQVSTSQNYTRAFNFSSNGTYSIVVNVSNDRLEFSTFDWTVYVMNYNRAPTVVNALPNLTSINTSTLFTNYFIGSGSSTVRFYDADDDTNLNGYIDGNESNTMTFSTASSCTVASLSISGAGLTVTPVSEGTCLVSFNATDASGATIESGTVVVNVTDVPEGETETTTVVSSGGGGGSSTTSSFVPISKDKNVPKAFHLITPKLVTVYDNQTIHIPIVINNTWDKPLKFVSLTAETNVSNVFTSFDTDFFEEIPVNESRNVFLTVANYRLGENYELTVRGNVTDPSYEDEALILLNSIQSASDGDNVRVKVTFANDLLSEHPECQELSEVLDQAKVRLEENDLDEAKRLVEGVISGCKYLVNSQQKFEEKPSKINPIITIDSLSAKTIMWSVLAFILVLTIALLTLYHYTHKPEDDV